MYDFSKLTLDDDKITKIIKVNGDVLIALEDLQIIFPKRFASRGLTTYDGEIRALGIFAIMDTKGNYSVSTIPNRLSLSPNVIDDVTLDTGEVYTVFTFYKDNIISSNTTMVKDSSFLNIVYNEFIVQGKVPKFFWYEDLIKVFKHTLEFNNSNLGKYNEPIQLLISMIARDISDKAKPFRLTGKVGKPGEISWVGLSNVHYAVTSTLNKLGGGHAGAAMFSAINNDVEMSMIEDILIG